MDDSVSINSCNSTVYKWTHNYMFDVSIFLDSPLLIVLSVFQLRDLSPKYFINDSCHEWWQKTTPIRHPLTHGPQQVYPLVLQKLEALTGFSSWSLFVMNLAFHTKPSISSWLQQCWPWCSLLDAGTHRSWGSDIQWKQISVDYFWYEYVFGSRLPK